MMGERAWISVASVPTATAITPGEVHMPVDVSPLIHIEMAVPDAEAAYRFLHDVFGAEKVEEEFASFLDGPYARVIHVGLGDVVLQFIEPRVEEGSWYEQLKRSGPGVHNLTFVVDDIREAVRTLEAEGAPVLFSFPLDWARLLGPDNVKPDAQPVHMVGSMEKLGFHLELAESPLKEPPEPAGPRAVVGRVSPLLHVEIVVRDVEETCRFLHAVFGAERVEEEFASFLDSSFMKIAHVLLGDVVLQLCQPLVEGGSWYEQLRDHGPGVHNITFIVDDLPEVAAAMERSGVTPLLTFPLDWGRLVGAENVRPDVPNVHMMDTMKKLGFHLELAEKPTDGALSFLYKAV
jgi:catechol 2,3-dioxygenase-like lactoylglutathione lyase family enzyme